MRRSSSSSPCSACCTSFMWRFLRCFGSPDSSGGQRGGRGNGRCADAGAGAAAAAAWGRAEAASRGACMGPPARVLGPARRAVAVAPRPYAAPARAPPAQPGQGGRVPVPGARRGARRRQGERHARPVLRRRPRAGAQQPAAQGAPGRAGAARAPRRRLGRLGPHRAGPAGWPVGRRHPPSSAPSSPSSAAAAAPADQAAAAAPAGPELGRADHRGAGRAAHAAARCAAPWPPWRAAWASRPASHCTLHARTSPPRLSTASAPPVSLPRRRPEAGRDQRQPAPAQPQQGQEHGARRWAAARLVQWLGWQCCARLGWMQRLPRAVALRPRPGMQRCSC